MTMEVVMTKKEVNFIDLNKEMEKGGLILRMMSYIY